MRRSARSLTALSLAVGLALAGGAWWLVSSGDRQADAELRDSLAAGIQGAQQEVWAARELLLRDREQGVEALADAASLVDVRTERSQNQSGWFLLDLSDDAGAVVLTVVDSQNVEAGGGLAYRRVDGATCFGLRLAADASLLETRSADCPVDLSERLPGALRPDTEVVALADLNAARTVDASDYPSKKCQCVSGSPCECSGG